MKARFLKHVVSTFGFSVAQQGLGLGRHILIAAYFGVSRDYDSYLLVYAMATYVIFNLSMVFDTVAVSRFVQIQERSGDAAFWQASNRLLLQSLLAGLAFSCVLILFLNLLLPIVAAGFTTQERADVLKLAFSFIPWGLIVLPYYALTAHLKALWRFHWVFAAELLVMLSSILFLWQWHDSIHFLPLAYAFGYFMAFILLLVCRGIVWPRFQANKDEILPGLANQHFANQIGSVVGLVDRFFQSHLMSGGISALGYAGQIVTNLSSLITFREIYVVPLSSADGREEKLDRVLKGVLLISMPLVVYLVVFAGPIVRLLFQRGNFTIEAAEVTADIVRILSVSLITTPLMLPLFRLVQILNRIAYSHVFYTVSLLCTVIFQYLFVFHWKMDVRGVAWAGCVNSIALTIFMALLMKRFGIHINWLCISQYAVYSCAVSAVAGLLAHQAAAGLADFWALLAGGGIFAVIVLVGFAAIHRQIRVILGLK